jgi:SAM-dependent methyltransferase
MRLELNRLRRLRIYDPATHDVYERGVELKVPAGQSVYDPAVFGRYDRATQRVVSAREDDGVWSVGFDELMVASQDHARAWPGSIQRDRYALALSLLAPGCGICLDACTGSPDSETRERITSLGYEYLPIDIESEAARREDVTALTFADASIARIVSLDTLEHVEDYGKALGEFHRVLEPGGVLIVHVPSYFVDRPSSAPLDAANDPWGHVRYFSAREFAGAVTDAGFALLRMQLHLDYGATLCVAGKP